MRRTEQAQRVAAALLDNDRSWGYQLGKQARVRGGTLYPILYRFHAAGWIDVGGSDDEESWADLAAGRPTGRPPRRYYTVTPAGRQALTELAGDNP